MIAVEMSFLAHRFHATPWGSHVNEGAVEWPPSSWRFLRALVAVFHRARPADVTEDAVRRIVSALSSAAPQFALPAATTAHTRHFDQANGGLKFLDSFVAFDRDARLRFLWPEAELSGDDRRALASLLANLTTFGRAESWCEATLVDGARAPDADICAPVDPEAEAPKGEPVRVLVPEPGENVYDHLLVETSAMRKAKRLEPAGARWAHYVRPAGAFVSRPAQRRSPARPKPTVARFELHSTVLPLVQGSLWFGEKVRRCMIRNRCATEHSEAITGKTEDGVKLSGHRHAHYLPTDEKGAGRITHLTIYCPLGFDAEDVRALDGMRTITRPEDGPDIHLTLTALGERDQFAGPYGGRKKPVPLFKSARVWRSATPFSLPCYSTRGHGLKPRAKDRPEGQLFRELRSRGLPEPVRVDRLVTHQVENRAPIPWLDFASVRHNRTRGHGLVGFEIEFADEVSGPIAVGFGSHFGLGLFLPAE